MTCCLRVFLALALLRKHAHRLRDTFADQLLLNGTLIENVPAFLGHASVRISERHYPPWVRERQERAERM